jgi:hypothetical protein
MGAVSGTASPGGGASAGSLVVQGTVHGGQQPIAQSTVTLWTVGTSGYGSAPTQLTTTMSNSNGSFALPAPTCAQAGELTYLTATGGSPGVGAPANTQISLMTLIGVCSGASSMSVNVDEVTTVASVYALSQFMDFATGHIGYPNGGSAAITSAFAVFNNLVNVNTGAAYLYTPAGTGLVPQAEINTLANLLALCVNSSGSTANGQPCAVLYAATPGTSPANTLQVVYDIATNPTTNVTGLFNIAPTNGPFQPTLTSAPSNWNVQITTVAPVAVSTSSLPSATVGYSYSQTLTATGGSGNDTWSITSGQSALAAAGINFNSSGQFYGTPGSSGSYPITVQVNDASTGLTATANLTLTITANVNNYSCGSSTLYSGSTISVSGTVTYAGTKTGRIYLALLPTCGGGGGNVGTSISSAGTFTIRGVPANTSYSLEAFMDTEGYGAPNTADPSGSVSVSVGTGSASGMTLALSDPSVVTPNSAFSLSSVTAFNNGVVAFYNPAKYNGTEAATSYTLQWSTTSSFSSIAGSKTFPPVGTHNVVWFVNGLSNGSTYYFRAYAVENGVNSSYSTLSSAVTVGAPTGTSTVSGTVSFPGTATGPLYVGYLNNVTGNFYLQYIANPVSAQAYSVQIPAGSYQPVAFIDQNNDGVVDAGDPQNVVGYNGVSVVFSGTTTGANIALPGGNALAVVGTHHYFNASGVTTDYTLQPDVQIGLKQPVIVTLVSGPNVTGPMDIALCGQTGSNCGPGFVILADIGLNTPSVGDTYTFNLTYSDGTTGTVTAAVTAVLNGYASNLAPTGTGGSTTPTFTWTDPANASNYTYEFSISVTSGSGVWTVPSGNGNLTSATTSLVWGTDPTNSSNTPSVAALTGGTNYSWDVQVDDAYGNWASTQVNYTPSSTAPTISTSNLPSATVGSSYSQQFSASGGSGNYSWSITSGQSALTAAGITFSSSGLLSGTPTSSGSYAITVKVTDTSTGLTSSAPYTVIVNSSSGSSSGCPYYGSSNYTVSGTVSYAGAKTGRIYLALTCGTDGTGTSISSAGTFTIHGVPSGTYTLEAFMDTLGKGADNGADPLGSTTVTVGASSVSGVSLTLTDPATVTLTSGPSIQSMSGFNGGVFGLYGAIKSNNIEQATSYTLQWSTSSSFTTIAGSKTFAADGTHTTAWLVNGLSNGSVYYFRAYGTSAGTAVSPYSSVYGPVTIGAPTGANTVSGSVSFTGTATGPMYVGLLNNTTNAVYLQYMASPANTQAYSVQAPSGSYELVAILDQNNDGIIDAGDLQNTNFSQSPAISITGSIANENITLPSGNSVALVETQNYVSTAGVTQSYNLDLYVQEMAKLPVAVQLTSGSGVTVPIDIALCGLPGSGCGQGFRISAFFGTTAPTVGNTYSFNVTYSDGTTATVTAMVTAVLTGYAYNLAPTGSGVSTTPTFTWTDPANASNYIYEMDLSQASGGTIWIVPGNGALPTSTTSITWGVDPTDSGNTPTVSSLSAGTLYDWEIKVTDSNGNQVVTQASFTTTGTSSPLSIQTTSLSGGQLSTAYAQYISVTGGTTPYTAQVSSGSLPPGLSLATCNSCSGYFSLSGTPSQTGTYSFTVKVTDSENPTVSVSQAYSVTIGSSSLSQCTHDGSGNAILNGHYAFLLGGFDPNGHYYDQIGSFVANGAGTISGGLADANGDNTLSQFSSGEQQYTFSGTYSIGSTDDRGIMTVSNSNTSATGLPATSIYCFAADTVTSGVANSGRIIEADGTGYIQTGVFALQNTANFSASALNSGYAFGVQGVGNPPNREVAVGQFTLNGAGGVSSGQLDFALASNSGTSETYYAAQSIGSSGGYTMASGGRGTLTLGSLNFVTYEFGNNQLFMLSTTNYNPPLLLGQATPQTLTTFTTANVAGRGVIRSDGTPGAVADNMQVGVLTYDGAGNATFISDENDAGTITTPSSVQTATYAVTSLGYLTLPGAGSHPVNMYLYAPGGGYGVSSASQVDFWTMVPQTVPNGGFTSSSVSGAYTLGTIPNAAYSTTGAGLTDQVAYPDVQVGQITFGSGTLSLIEDEIYPPGIAADVSTGETGSVSWALDSTYGASYGRVLLGGTGGGGLVGYIVSPSQVVLMNDKSGKDGGLYILDHQ